MVQAMQDEDDDSNDDSDSSEEERDHNRGRNRRRSKSRNCLEWSGHQCVHYKKTAFDQMNTRNKPTKDLEMKLMLDTGSTINVTTKNQDFLTNICNSENPIVTATNAGMKRMTLDGDMPGVGVAKYDPEQLANILGFSHMAEKYLSLIHI